MLFNSYSYILVFLPLVVFLYYILKNKSYHGIALVYIPIVSLFFYSFTSAKFLPIFILSICCNYWISKAILSPDISPKTPKRLLILGIFFNLSVLGFFKYSDFVIDNINILLNTSIPFFYLSLPLAISFFTFQQIAYLVDVYTDKKRVNNFGKYVAFVSFFPQLIAGPIVHHKTIMPQFDTVFKTPIKYDFIAKGLFLFSIGLFKKVVIADSFAIWATNGFDYATTLTFVSSWVAVLSYTFQLYFDFSGYTDMALGAGYLFGISLPINFNSPYKACSIQDFWARWHITLSQFLKAYLYIPLGGNRKGPTRTGINLMITFLLGGLWHGASWLFIIWGFLHGVGSLIEKIWRSFNIRLPKIVAWMLTFFFINITWIFFRAKSMSVCINLLNGILGRNGFICSLRLKPLIENITFIDLNLSYGPWLAEISQYGNRALLGIIIGFCLVILFSNSQELTSRLKPSIFTCLFTIILLVISLGFINDANAFLYFNF